MLHQLRAPLMTGWPAQRAATYGRAIAAWPTAPLAWVPATWLPTSPTWRNAAQPSHRWRVPKRH